ncbi:MAG: acyl-CoA thioesterase [Alphaproteobacteria bacterium]|nr:acyl-CoA thioesterase [Alphaproteobacteria bacterium]
MGLKTRLKTKVEWGDCDPAGQMFYPNYFRYVDAATHHLLETAGIGIPALMREFAIMGLPLVDAQLSFKARSRWGARIEVESTIVEWRRKTLVVGHRIWNGDVVAVEGREIRVWARTHPDDPERLQAGEIPAAVVARYEEADRR